jgi:feruloyl esterase
MNLRITYLLIATLPCFGQSIASKCPGLTSPGTLPNPTTRITAATLNASTATLREHCEVLGRMNERTGVNAQNYSIKFHLRLPTEWNGRFFFEGGGGSNGNLGNALGNLQGQQRTNALSMGFAVVSTDSGHDNAINNDPNRNGTVTFGFDPQARRDFGYNSYDQVAQAAKALIRAYYGRAPERSYYAGCSEGGREAMMMSQRFPDYFDGIRVPPGSARQGCALRPLGGRAGFGRGRQGHRYL